ncbi:hypothetical protein PRUPE_2G022800 [Prunus persica]|uniref:Uncharacterized protein n=1 Tax=Prunus persica TaxID=3760 RepID=A0A251Q9P9_PRUPE|nr:hypothetical protein PRUPE_2G022800 [Prunus persica]
MLVLCPWIASVWFGSAIGYRVDLQSFTSLDRWLGSLLTWETTRSRACLAVSEFWNVTKKLVLGSVGMPIQISSLHILLIGYPPFLLMLRLILMGLGSLLLLWLELELLFGRLLVLVLGVLLLRGMFLPLIGSCILSLRILGLLKPISQI